MSLEGKVSIVTGASQGIGQAIALELAAAGAAVHLVDIQLEKLNEVAGRVRSAGGQASVHAADVAQAGQVEAVVQAVLAGHKRIDHLVNNAGITRDNLLMRMKEEEWDAVLEINLKGAFLFSKAVIRPMISQRSGRIVNMASVVGLMGNAGQANYAASKAGLIGFSKSLAREVASRGITVNCLAPGYIATPMTERLPEEVKRAFLEVIPMKRFGTPEEVARIVLFLLSDAAAYITGQVLGVSGGMYM
ncbi:MAG: 3-oxoacyl-[acyl-carrier-protein] reductase [Candidatus Aminicenantales bacterium]